MLVWGCLCCPEPCLPFAGWPLGWPFLTIWVLFTVLFTHLLSALQALTLAGLKVPDDIAIIGYDDIEFAGSAAIPLTSIRQPAVEVGKEAIALLLDAIENPDDASPKQVILNPELVVRRSTQPS